MTQTKVYEHPRSGSGAGFDPSKRFVRERTTRPDGFVEFDFAIGDPDLAVELMLPKAAFEEFCRINHVIRITDAQAQDIDRERQKWQHGEPGADA